jgi:hypothetical protein
VNFVHTLVPQRIGGGKRAEHSQQEGRHRHGSLEKGFAGRLCAGQPVSSVFNFCGCTTIHMLRCRYRGASTCRQSPSNRFAAFHRLPGFPRRSFRLTLHEAYSPASAPHALFGHCAGRGPCPDQTGRGCRRSRRTYNDTIRGKATALLAAAPAPFNSRWTGWPICRPPRSEIYK